MSDQNATLKCDDCGRFMAWKVGASTARIFDFVAREPLLDHFRCAPCGEKLGPVQSNATPWNGDMSPYQNCFSPDGTK